MKKVFSLLLLIGSVFSFSIITTKANDPFTLQVENLYSNFYAITIEADLPAGGAYGLELTIPTSDYHRITYGNITSYLSIDNLQSTEIYNDSLFDIKGSVLSGTYYISFSSLGLDPTNVGSFYILIMQSFSSIPSGYYDYLENNITFNWRYDYDDSIFWNSIKDAQNDYAISTYIQIPLVAKVVDLYIPDSPHHTNTSIIKLYNTNYSLVYTGTINEFSALNISNGYISIDPLALGFSLGTIQYIYLEVKQIYERLPNDYLIYLNDNSTIEYNRGIIIAQFLSETGTLYYENEFRNIPNRPTDPTPISLNDKFVGWYDINNEAYDFTTPVRDNQIRITAGIKYFPLYPVFVEIIYDLSLTWISSNLFGSYYAIISDITLSRDAKVISIYIPESEFHEDIYGGVENSLVFYDDNDIELLNIPITDVTFGTVSGLIKFDVENLGLDIGEAARLEILIPETYSQTPSGYVAFLEEESYIQYNDDLYFVNYIVDGVSIYRDLFSTIPPDIGDPTAPGYDFIGWYKADGTKYNYEAVTEDMLFNNEFFLYAQYEQRTPIIVDIEDPDANTFMANVFSTLNLNTQVGYVIVYLISILGALVALRRLNLGNTLLLISMILITALFMFLGFLPILMSLIAFGVFALILIYDLRGGYNV